jgi:hypothetical protein
MRVLGLIVAILVAEVLLNNLVIERHDALEV